MKDYKAISSHEYIKRAQSASHKIMLYNFMQGCMMKWSFMNFMQKS